MAKLKLDDETVRGLAIPATGIRIDYDERKGERDAKFVRGFSVRTSATGLKTFLLVYMTKAGIERRQKIGDFGPHTVTTARDKARKLRIRVDNGEDPYADAKAQRANAEAQRVKDAATFGGLMDAYVASLRRAGKASTKKVAAEIKRNIEMVFPALWKQPAASVSIDDLVGILNRLTKVGKHRAAGKVRAYVRAAYGAAAAARGDASAADLFDGYTALPNIARDLATIDAPKSADDLAKEAESDVLSLDELRAYWKRIAGMPTKHAALLRVHLLLGGQRCEQLARITRSRINRDGKTVLIFDSKGKRKRPREHLVPLLDEALEAFDSMAGEGEFAYSLDGGKHAAGYHTTRAVMRDVADAMVEKKEVSRTFTPGTIRRTVETRLADAGVAKEDRAHLLSHGLGGVQAKHYDRHTYFDEKRAALTTLRELLAPPIKGKAARKRTRRA